MKLAILTACAAIAVLLYRERQRERREKDPAVDGLLDQLRAVIASPVVDEAQRRRDALGRTRR